MTLARATPPEPVSATIADDAAKSQTWDMVDEWGLQSFPASDPPSNW